jgi:hypothetical protein
MPDHSLNGLEDAVVFVLDPDGSELRYSTYLAGGIGTSATASALRRGARWSSAARGRTTSPHPLAASGTPSAVAPVSPASRVRTPSSAKSNSDNLRRRLRRRRHLGVVGTRTVGARGDRLVVSGPALPAVAEADAGPEPVAGSPERAWRMPGAAEEAPLCVEPASDRRAPGTAPVGLETRLLPLRPAPCSEGTRTACSGAVRSVAVTVPGGRGREPWPCRGPMLSLSPPLPLTLSLPLILGSRVRRPCLDTEAV